MSYCLNPKCPNPTDPLHAHHRICRHCGSVLQLQGRYRVQSLLGEGGFGRTYQVWDEQAEIRGTSAVKVLKVLSSQNPKAIALFQREAEVLQRLHHPGIPQVEPDGYFIFTGRNQEFELHCLVMEFIAGENLEKWMSDRNYCPITETQAVEWLIQLVEILQQVHQHNYFHRDIKPSNIMRRFDAPDAHGQEHWGQKVGQLALIDFGSVREVSGTYLAKVAGGGSPVTGIISPGYTPPEQANGKAVPQSDFYALARTFVFLLTGKEPNVFPEDAGNGELQWRSQVQHIFPPLLDLLDYMMAPFPGNRPQNTYLIWQQLQEIRRCLSGGQFGDYSRPAWRNRHRSPISMPLQPAIQATATGSLSGTYRGKSYPLPPRTQSFLPAWVLPYQITHRHHRRSRRHPLRQYMPKLVMGAIALTLPVTALQLANELNLQYLIAPTAATAPSNLPTAPVAPSPLRLGTYPLENLITPGALTSFPLEALPVSRMLSQPLSDHTRVPGKDFVLTNTLQSHVWAVNTVDLSPDAKILVSGSVDKTVKIWEVATGNLLRTLSAHSQQVWSVATSPDGKMLVSAGGDNQINLWEISSGEQLHRISDLPAWVTAVAFSPDSKTLASGLKNGMIILWNVENDVTGFPKGVKRQQLSGHSDRVQAIAFVKSHLPSPPMPSILVSGSIDGTIQIWNLADGSILRTLQHPREQLRALAVSPDGQQIASGHGDGTFNLWDLNTGELRLKVKAHSDAVRAIAFGGDGRTVITGGAALDPLIRVWDATTGERLQVLSGHTDTVHSLKLSADGQILTSGSEDNTIKIWRILAPHPENPE